MEVSRLYIGYILEKQYKTLIVSGKLNYFNINYWPWFISQSHLKHCVICSVLFTVEQLIEILLWTSLEDDSIIALMIIPIPHFQALFFLRTYLRFSAKGSLRLIMSANRIGIKNKNSFNGSSKQGSKASWQLPRRLMETMPYGE